MPTDLNIFKAIGDLAVGAKRRADKDYADFLSFYRELVETLPSEVTELFGTLSEVWIKRRGAKDEGVGLELNVTDFLWWKNEIECGTRFSHGITQVKSDMLGRLAIKAETQRLSPDERKALIALLDGPEA